MNKISDLKVNDFVALKNGYIDIFINKRHRGCGAIILEKHHHVHDYQIDWQKTNELNNKQMKELIIEAPTGMEWYRENDTIKFRNIENKLPMSVEEIPNRNYAIFGSVIVTGDRPDLSFDYQLSTKERAEAFLALMQLVELRDAWNGGWIADYNNGTQPKYCLTIKKGITERATFALYFKSGALRDQFAEQFKDLIETAKELL